MLNKKFLYSFSILFSVFFGPNIHAMRIREVDVTIEGENSCALARAFLYPFDTDTMTLEEFSQTDAYHQYMALGAPDPKIEKSSLVKEPEFPKKLEDSAYAVCPPEVKAVIDRYEHIDGVEIEQDHLQNIVILHGECGTGKSEFVPLIARRTNRELTFILSAFLGNVYVDSETVNLKELIIPLARNESPCVVGIEDGECLRTSQLRLICNFAERYPHILFVFTTSELDRVEQWFLNLVRRRGTIIHTPLPNQNARRHILNYLLREHKSNSNVDDRVINNTAGFSIRDLQNLVRDARLKALRRTQDAQVKKTNLETMFEITNANVKKYTKDASKCKYFRETVQKYKRENRDDRGDGNNKHIIVASCFGVLLVAILSYLYFS